MGDYELAGFRLAFQDLPGSARQRNNPVIAALVPVMSVMGISIPTSLAQ